MTTDLRVPLFAAALAFASPALSSPITYTADLSGPAEEPPVASTATGSTTIVFDSDAHLLSVDVDFAGLVGTTTASHIHCCTGTPFAGTAPVATQVPTFVDFPLGVTSGTYSRDFDLSDPASWNPAFIADHGGTAASAEAALSAGLAGGMAYLNVHSTFAPSGEIRGFLVASSVSLPGTLALIASAFAAALAVRRQSRPGTARG